MMKNMEEVLKSLDLKKIKFVDYGLRKLWFTQLEVDRGKFTGITFSPEMELDEIKRKIQDCKDRFEHND